MKAALTAIMLLLVIQLAAAAGHRKLMQPGVTQPRLPEITIPNLTLPPITIPGCTNSTGIFETLCRWIPTGVAVGINYGLGTSYPNNNLVGQRTANQDWASVGGIGLIDTKTLTSGASTSAGGSAGAGFGAAAGLNLVVRTVGGQQHFIPFNLAAAANILGGTGSGSSDSSSTDPVASVDTDESAPAGIGNAYFSGNVLGLPVARTGIGRCGICFLGNCVLASSASDC